MSLQDLQEDEPVASFALFKIHTSLDAGTALDMGAGQVVEGDGLPVGGFAANNAATVECWVYHDELLADRTSRYVTLGSETAVIRHKTGNLGCLQNYFKLDGSLCSVAADDALDPNANRPYHVAGVWDGSHIRLYLDGTEIGSADPTGKILTMPDGNIDLGHPSEYLDGSLDEVRIYDVALTAEQIRDRMHKTLDGNETGLVAYFQMDETEGDVVSDAVGGADLTRDENTGFVSSPAPLAGEPVRSRDDLRAAWPGKNDPSYASSILSLSDADISAPDFVAFGHDGGALEMSDLDRPSGFASRLGRAWQLQTDASLTGDLSFDCAGVAGIVDPERLWLLVEDDGDFSDAEYCRGVWAADVFTVADHDYQDGAWYSIGELAAGNRAWFVDPSATGNGSGFAWTDASLTIQNAIDAAYDGDTVLVKYGNYSVSSSLVLQGKNVRLTSDDADYDREQTVVVANENCRLFTITGEEVTDATVVRGFAFTGGNATDESSYPNFGGGILLASGADAVVEHCEISYCVASTDRDCYGGGIYITDAGTEPTIRHCNVVRNIALRIDNQDNFVAKGGGICLSGGARPALQGLLIDGNESGSGPRSGGGIGMSGGRGVSFEITDCIISNNLTDSDQQGEGNPFGELFPLRQPKGFRQALPTEHGPV